jgi:putative transposase
MITARKYRLYPNKAQKQAIDAHIDAVRIIYNLALETKNISYYNYGKILSRYDLQVQLKDCKTEFPWLKQINSQSLQGALMHLDASFLKYFRDLKNGTIVKKKSSYLENKTKKGLKINWDKYNNLGKPKFKSKKDSIQSFLVPQNFTIVDNKLFIPKIKTGIKVIVSQECVGEFRNATISRTNTGKYFVSIVIENNLKVPAQKEVKEDTSVGIDVGIKTFAVLSSGEEIGNPKFLKKSIVKLKVLQKRASKKKKNSKNKQKANKKIALLHEKITNQRKDFLHKTSSAIIKQYDTVIVEDLNISGMVKNHKLAQSISDVSWSSFSLMLKYKLAKNGKNFIEIDRFFPSSKMHYKCGYINKNLTLIDREWNCPICKETVLRDYSAAINIKLSGLGQSVEPLELPTLVGTLKKESHLL